MIMAEHYLLRNTSMKKTSLESYLYRPCLDSHNCHLHPCIVSAKCLTCDVASYCRSTLAKKTNTWVQFHPYRLLLYKTLQRYLCCSQLLLETSCQPTNELETDQDFSSCHTSITVSTYAHFNVAALFKVSKMLVLWKW